MFLTEPPDSDLGRQLYAGDREDDGYVNNLTRLWCWRPDIHRGFATLRGSVVETSELAPADVAVLYAAAAAARSDAYCSLAWGSRLAAETDADTAGRVLTGAVEALDSRTAALTRWARLVAADPNATTQADVDVLRAAGLSDLQIAEATMLVAFRLAFATVNDALGALPDRQLAEAAPPQVAAAVDFGRPPDGALSS